MDDLSLKPNEVVVKVALVLEKAKDTSFGITSSSSSLGFSSSELAIDIVTVEKEVEQVVVEQDKEDNL